MSSMLYVPPVTVEKFMLDDHRIRVIVGPLGSGKSMGAIMELLKKSCEQTPHNGVRYTRWALVRNTLQQLRQTVLADVKQYLEGLCSYYATDSTIQLRFSLPDGTRVHSDWMLLPLDTREDVRRLLSLQLTGAWVNECREVPMEIMKPLLGRTGRYPSKANGGASWRGIICDTNPWSIDSEWHDKLVLHPHPAWALFHQPSGIGPFAENVENLPPGYYEDMLDEHGSEFATVHIESEFGSSNAGQAVFRRSFNAATHCRDLKQITNPMRPIIVGMDFGRTPCALIGQVDVFGRLIVYKEVTSEDMNLNQFLEEKLLPALAVAPFTGRSVFVVGDPAGNQKTQLSDENCFTTLKSHGFQAYPASTNDIAKRLMAVEKILLKHPAGEPGLQISRAGCTTLITAMGAKYLYRKKKDGELEDRPEKRHPWSDICDALQYMCLGVQMNLVGKVMQRQQPRIRSHGRIPSGAWT